MFEKPPVADFAAATPGSGGWNTSPSPWRVPFAVVDIGEKCRGSTVRNSGKKGLNIQYQIYRCK